MVVIFACFSGLFFPKQFTGFMVGNRGKELFCDCHFLWWICFSFAEFIVRYFLWVRGSTGLFDLMSLTDGKFSSSFKSLEWLLIISSTLKAFFFNEDEEFWRVSYSINRAFARSQIYRFYIFPWKYVKKAFQIQIFRIFESFFDFIFNFEVYNLGLKTFKKALSLKRIFMERKLFESF